MQRSTGMVLVVGSLVFLAGVLLPTVQEVFGDLDDPAAMALAIGRDESQWTGANVLFGVGALMVAGGLWGLGRSSTIGMVSGVSAGVGALVYGYTAVLRITESPEEVAAAINDPDWKAPVYAVLTSVALTGIGYVVAQAGSPKWLGWFLVVVGLATLVGYFVLGDMPPGVYYVVTLVAGVTVLFSRQPDAPIA